MFIYWSSHVWMLHMLHEVDYTGYNAPCPTVLLCNSQRPACIQEQYRDRACPQKWLSHLCQQRLLQHDLWHSIWWQARFYSLDASILSPLLWVATLSHPIKQIITARTDIHPAFRSFAWAKQWARSTLKTLRIQSNYASCQPRYSLYWISQSVKPLSPEFQLLD